MTTPVTFTVPLTQYVPSNNCPFTGAEALWLTQEFQKLQRLTVTLTAALNQLAAAV
jgi:hypothetical protein